MNAPNNQDDRSSSGSDSASSPEERSKWEDPAVPVGDSPPMPRWPIAVFAMAWIAWLVFLVAMMWSRNQIGPS